MATAEELLSGSVSQDRTFVIDSDLRTIIIPKNITNLGVESDDDVMIVPFRMPATYCGISLSAFKIKINYLNANAEPDVYEVDSVAINADGTMSFSWLVGRHAAMYKGDVKFSVCMKDVNSTTGEVRREFNTAIATLPILEGLETGEQAIAEYNDIFEQWKASLFGEGNSAVNLINTAKDSVLMQIAAARDEAIASIPADYTAAAEAADESVRTKADAIVQTVCGRAVYARDSSDDYLRGLRLLGRTEQTVTTGKNLLDAPEVAAWSGTLGKSINIPAGTYVLSYEVATWHGANAPFIRFATNDKWYQLDNSSAEISVKFDVEETQLYMYSNGSSAANSEGVSAVVQKLMLSATGGEYEPYSKGVSSPSLECSQPLVSALNATVKVLGKNLIDMSSHPRYSDGAVGVEYSTGNSIDSCFAPVEVVPGETYTFSYVCDGGDRIVVKLIDVDGANIGRVDLGWGSYLASYSGVYGTVGESGATMTVPQDSNARYMQIYLCQMSDVGEGGYNIYTDIQLEHGSVATEYEPYRAPQTIHNDLLSGGLFGFPVTEGGNYTDQSGQQWVCDEVDFARGVYVKRFTTRTFTGASENWSQYLNADNGINQFYIMTDDCYQDTQQINAMSPQLRGIRLADRPWSYGSVYTANQSGYNYVCVNLLQSDFADAAAFKAHLQTDPLVVVYRLKDPKEVQLSDEAITTFRSLRSIRPATSVVNDGATPMEVSYNADTKTYVQNLLADTLEVIENGSY